MPRDGGWRDGALAIVPRGGHKRRLAGLLLVLLSSWWSPALAENGRRLLSGPYPDLASAVTAGRSIQNQLAQVGIVYEPGSDRYQLVLADSSDEKSLANARRRAAAMGLPSPRIVPADDASPPPLPLGDARSRIFSDRVSARREVERVQQRGGLADVVPVQRQQALTIVQLGGYPQRADASQEARRLEAAGIDTLVVPFGAARAFSISVGAYRQKKNVRKQIRRLAGLGFTNIGIIRLKQSLTNVRLVGYDRRRDAEQDVQRLEAAGIDTLIISPGAENGFAISTGAFREQRNVYHQIRRLSRLGYSNIYVVPLERDRAESYQVTTLLPEGERLPAAPSRLAGPVANSEGVMIGSQPGPVPEATQQDPRAANNLRLVVDPIWIEAGALADGEARAKGSHYLRSTLAMEWFSTGNWEARLGGRVDGYAQSGDDDFEKSELDYDESYLRYRDANRTVTLGAQTVLWGRVDELPPTDRLSVRDVSRFVLDDLEDRRRAVPAVRWEEFVGEHKLDLLYVPQFRAAELPQEESVWFPVDRSRGRIIGLAPDPLMEPLVKAGRFVEEDDGFGGWGLRLSRTGHNLDYAFTVQDARHSLPYYALAPAVRQSLLADPSDVAGALAAAPATFIGRHPRTWVVGGDLAFSAGRSTWRLEAAWLSDHPATTEDLRYTTVEALDWVAGVEFFPGDRNLRMSAQVRGLHLLSPEDELLDRETIYTLFGDIENTFRRGHWGARLRYSIGLDERDVYLNPELAFRGREPHEFYLAYHYFDGVAKTPGGFHQHHDLLALGWRARF